MNTAQVQQVIDSLNDIYNPITNIHFYRICDISFVNNSNYANNGDQYFNEYTLNNKTSGALNVHFVIHSGAQWAGKANFPFPIIFTNDPNPRAYSCAVRYIGFTQPFLISELSEILAHEVGHTLGLYHTHQGRCSGNNEDCGECYQESVSRTKTQGLFCVSTVGKKKCEVNGDLLCDTPADPLLTYRVDYPCIYNYSGTDNWGDTWVPDTNNIMSYSFLSCLQDFSLLQIAKMYGYIGGIGINHTAFAISGNNAICAGQTATFTVNTLPGVSYYHWEVSPNLTIISGQGSSSVTIQAYNHGGGQLTVTPNCGNRPVSKTLTQLFSAPITGPDIMCVGAAPKYFNTTSYAGATYNWSISNGSILSGQGTSLVRVSVLPHSSNVSELYVAVSYCNNPFWGNKLINHVYSGETCDFQSPLTDIETNEVDLFNEIIIYPNPAKNSFTILAPDEQNYWIEIADKNGWIIYQNNASFLNEITINAETFATGIYFILIKNEYHQFIKRLIIKK